ncbi:MAG TPA: hypothetical protein PLJ74_06525 [Myxococcota bacterium]|nr:hypothetical protein [Myxococcota bacterium]
MKSLLKVAVLSLVVVGFLAADASAQVTIEQVPMKINVQGVLRNPVGQPITGEATVQFVLYDAAVGGNIVASIPASMVTLYGGVFDEWLPVDANVFVNREHVYLGISVNGEAELPRVEIGSVGFAIQAYHAEFADVLLGPATDLQCDGCVDATDMGVNYAGSTSKGGPAIGLNCIGCVEGGTKDGGGHIKPGSIIGTDIVALAITEYHIASSAVTESKLATDAVTTMKIKDGNVTGVKLADGAITSGKIAAGAVGSNNVSFNYAGSNTKGGPATGLECNDCVNNTQLAVNYAGSNSKGGPATNLECTNCVGESEVAFNWARANTPGGAARDVACTAPSGDPAACISPYEVDFDFARGVSRNGAAADLQCNGCVGDSDVGFNYAGSTSKGGPATGLACTGCVTATHVSFNYANSNGPAGDAIGLTCNGCVDTQDLANAAVTNAKVATGIAGNKIDAATSTARGTVRIGAGLTMNGEILTPNFGTGPGQVAQGDHTHTEFWKVTEDLNIAKGKSINFLDPADHPNFLSRIAEVSTGTGSTVVQLRFVNTQSSTNQLFEIWGETPIVSSRMHSFDVGGKAYHRESIELGGIMGGTGSTNLPAADIVKCPARGCIDTADIIDGTIQGVDIANNTIEGNKLASNISISTTGNLTAANVYASRYYDKDDNQYYADPNASSVMNTIHFSGNVVRRENTNAGLVGLRFRGAGVGGYNNTGTFGIQNEAGFCGPVEVFGDGCDGGTMTVKGNIRAYAMYDQHNLSYYVDPASTSMLNTVYAGGSYLNSANTNRIQGPTLAFQGAWKDIDNDTYQIDPSHTTIVNTFEARNGVKVMGWPGNFNGFAGVGNSGGHLYIGPDANASQYVIHRWGADDRMYFLLNDGTNTSRPSFRTNGHHLVINSGTGSRNLYLQWDVGGNTWVNGDLWANRFRDRDHSGCYMDPNSNSLIVNLGVNDIGANTGQVTNFRAVNMTVNGGGIWPVTHATATIGNSVSYFYAVYTMNLVNASTRDSKRDIYYLNNADIAAVGDIIYDFKPTTYFYKDEVPTAGNEQDENAKTRDVPHWGLILDEMPLFMHNKGGWSLNDSVGFLLVAAKYFEDTIRYQQAQIRDLEDRIAVLEQYMVDAGLIH